MRIGLILLMMLSTMLIACVEKPVKTLSPFEISSRQYLYEKTSWIYKGRLAVADSNNSFSGSIKWQHRDNLEMIELAGPFGQNRTIIKLTDNSVLVDSGDKKNQSFGNVDDLISKHMGIAFPVTALKYWVLGLVEPNTKYEEFNNGFLQSGWKVNYLEMQMVNLFSMPRKIRIERDKVKLKLIINEWEIQD